MLRPVCDHRLFFDWYLKQYDMHASDIIPIEMFNTLAGIHNRRIVGYSFACRKIEANIFSILFTRLVHTSLVCKDELSAEVYKLGGVPTELSPVTPDFFYSWSLVNSALLKNDMRELMESAFTAEFLFQKEYVSIMRSKKSIFYASQLNMMQSHLDLLREDHEKVNNLRGVLVRAA